MKEALVSLEQIKKYLVSYKPIENISGFPILNKSRELKTYIAFKELMEYYQFKTECEIAVNEIKQIVEIQNNLENDSIKKWVIKYHSLFENSLNGFGLEYLDSGNDNDPYLHLASLDIYVDKTPFIPLIQFWELQWLLYFGEYYLPKENRTIPDPKDYYYTPPNPNDPTDLSIVKINLCLV